MALIIPDKRTLSNLTCPPALIRATGDMLDKLWKDERGSLFPIIPPFVAGAYVGAPAAGFTAHYRGDGYTAGDWQDRSANNYDLVREIGIVSFTETDPTLITADANFNGLNSVDFNGTTDVLMGTALSNLISATAYDVFMVFRAESAGIDNTVSAGNRFFVTDSLGYFGAGQGSTQALCFNFDGTSDLAAATNSLNTTYGLRFRHDAGSVYNDLTGVTETSAVSGNTQLLTGTLRLGASWSTGPSGIFDGQLAELIIYNTILSGADLTTTQDYIANSYGLTW